MRGGPLGLVSAPITWDELLDLETADFTIATMPERDERGHGLGDAPYPPTFPKQEGEPPRVQPSRMNRANWTDKERQPAPDEAQQLD